jgi:hypothetical protein
VLVPHLEAYTLSALRPFFISKKERAVASKKENENFVQRKRRNCRIQTAILWMVVMPLVAKE